MKKIMLILNARQFPGHVISTAILIAGKTSSFLYAVFLKDFKASQEFNYPFPNDLAFADGRAAKEVAEIEDQKLIENEVRIFKNKCEKAGVAYDVEIDQSVSIKHLLQISPFSDLILLDAILDSDDFSIKDILIEAHCPILLISSRSQVIENLILCYDGKYSSIYAIKMFSYLFSEWAHLPATILHVTPTEKEQLPHLHHFHSWLSRHYPNLEIRILHGNAEEQLTQFIAPRSENSIVVMGSFGENTLSRIFHKSLSNGVLQKTKASLFITHE